jgi:hypothetical protein
MKWLLLFLVACGGSTDGLLNLGEASAPETSASVDGSKEALAETSTTDATTPTDARTQPGDFDASMMSTTITDASEKPTTDANTLDVAERDADYFCDLTCEPMCIRLIHPMHACCSRVGCGCTTSDAGGYCAP